jgi:hypothetical protein
MGYLMAQGDMIDSQPENDARFILLSRIVHLVYLISEEICTSFSTMPIPEVFIKALSPFPLFTTFVSPVTSKTPASSQALFIERTILHRSSMGNSSSGSYRKRSEDGKDVFTTILFE